MLVMLMCLYVLSLCPDSHSGPQETGAEPLHHRHGHCFRHRAWQRLARLQHAQQQGIVPAGDTDRWVEEQFDLQRYEEQEQDVKETDILSDDDEFCQSALSPSTDPDLEGPLSTLSLEGDTAEEEEEEEEDSKKDNKSQHAKLSHLGKQCAMSVASVDEQVPGEDIWVRRDSSTENETQDETQSWNTLGDGLD